ncbi:unnamed protein product [Rodentolepis nana]|uniref:ANAPC4_WD40 domain-containing protein n=1 Tax=Rodentolepis nana TaxID=102285 RepID=A0A0R3T7T2_RODNA|nr:unnamed protein product [Rodentolepis nana]
MFSYSLFSITGGAKARDYEVLRLSNATWESIPFAVPSESADGEQSTGAASAINHMDTSQPPPPSTSQPEDYEEEDEDGPASIQTNNTLSSLRHFVETAGKDSEALLKVLQNQQTRQKSSVQLSSESSSIAAAGLSQRTSAFDPDLSLQLEGKTGDFYRVERQKFKKLANSTQSNVFGNGSNVISPASAQQTVWIGCQNGDIFIHSCDSSQRRPLQSTRLPAGVTNIRHFSGRVFVSLSDGHIVVFRRQARHPADQSANNPGGGGGGGSLPPPPRTSSPIPRVSSTSQNCQLSIGEELAEVATAAGAWDLSEAVVIRFTPTAQSLVKSMAIVPTTLTLWVGNRNRVLVIDTTTFQRLYAFEVDPKSSHTVRQLCWCRDGVWISLRDDPTLRLFNAFTYEPMQTVDMAYIINETVDTGAYDGHLLAVSASVTALEASTDHLWIGTKGGHVACIPFEHDSASKQTFDQSNASKNSNSTSFENENFQEVAPPSSQLDLSRASVSGYGHTETVSFFSLVGGNPSLYNNSSAPPHSMQQPLSTDGLLMVSGGVGLVERQKSTPSITRKLFYKYS